ncbi:unnamed protein product, partial [Trichogramma brassicae]
GRHEAHAKSDLALVLVAEATGCPPRRLGSRAQRRCRVSFGAVCATSALTLSSLLLDPRALQSLYRLIELRPMTMTRLKKSNFV